MTSRQANGYYQYGANGTLSKLQGSHNLKVGGDYRTIGATIAELRRVDRHLQLHRRLQRQRARRPAARLSAEHEQHPAQHAARWLRPLRVRLRAGRLAREQQADDQLRRPPRARDRACRSANNQFAVNFDQNAVNPLNANANVIDPVTGARRQILGGLVFAGVERRADACRAISRRSRRRRASARCTASTTRRCSAAAGACTTRRGISPRPAPPAGVRSATRRDERAAGLLGRADGVAQQSVSRRRRAAERQHARPADRHRRRHLLRRSQQRRAARAAVLRRLPARAARRHEHQRSATPG